MQRSEAECARIMRELGIYSTTLGPDDNDDEETRSLKNSARVIISRAKSKIYNGEDLSEEEIRIVKLCANILYGHKI